MVVWIREMHGAETGRHHPGKARVGGQEGREKGTYGESLRFFGDNEEQD